MHDGFKRPLMYFITYTDPIALRIVHESWVNRRNVTLYTSKKREVEGWLPVQEQIQSKVNWWSHLYRKKNL